MQQVNIGIFLPLHDGWNREVARGVAVYSRNRPWRLFVWAAAIEAFHPPAGWRCHGVISRVAPPPEVVTADVPLVYVGRQDGLEATVDVSPDHHAIGRAAAQHLHEIGFRRMTYYGGPHFWSRLREEAFRASAAALGAQYLSCPVSLERAYRDVDWTDAAAHLSEWLVDVPGPLGLMGANDGYARIASQACHLAGLRVPEQVAIVGVDNDTLRCELTNRPLSSVDSAADRVGYAAAEALDRWLTEGRPPAGPILIPPRGLVRRRSTDVLAIADESVAGAVRFLRERAFAPLGVEEVAAAACLSRSALERRFKKHVGRSVQQEITRVRVQRACELLRSSDGRLDQIALACGFKSLAYFHTAFKREIGRTPVRYRRWIRSEPR